MDNKYKKLSDEFEIKLKKILSNYKSVKEQNKNLKAQLSEKENELKRAHHDIVVLENKCKHLQVAGSISGNIEDRLASKKQIDKLVQEIDKCIALLDE